jgi:hypothetical protein
VLTGSSWEKSHSIVDPFAVQPFLVHAFMSSQFNPPTGPKHLPAVQLLVGVQALPSSHVVPFTFGA